MISAQLERLQKDSANLEAFIEQLRRNGDDVRAKKIETKKDYLDNRIEEIMMVTA